MLLATLYALLWPDPAGAGSGPPGADKLVHALLFGALAVTTRWRFGPALTGLALVAAYAVLSELVQGALLPSRSGDAYDVVADGLGAIAGWVAVGRTSPRVGS